jgi:hypothetical protein
MMEQIPQASSMGRIAQDQDRSMPPPIHLSELGGKPILSDTVISSKTLPAF